MIISKKIRAYIHSLRSEKLMQAEREHTRSVLENFIRTHPITQAVYERPRPLQLHRPLRLLLIQRLVPLSLILILIVAVGSTAFAAEMSLPGDSLYPVKIYVTEEVRTVIAFSPEAKAHWAVQRTERRLLEAEKLALRNALNQDQAQFIQQQVQKHADEVATIATQLKNTGHAEAAAYVHTSLEVVLDSHGEILINVGARPLVSDIPRLGDILDHVADQLELSVEQHEEIQDEDKDTMQPNAREASEHKIAAAQSKINGVKKYIEQVQSRIAKDIVTKSQGMLAEAEQLLAKARADNGQNLFQEAFAKASYAHQLAQQAKIIVSTAQKLKLDLVTESRGDGEEDVYAENEGSDFDGGTIEERIEQRIEHMRERAERMQEHSEKKQEQIRDRDRKSKE